MIDLLFAVSFALVPKPPSLTGYVTGTTASSSFAPEEREVVTCRH